MENALLELKGKLKMLYASYGSYLLVLFKFLLAFLVFEEINRLLPYVEGLDQIFVVLLASLICSIMPWNLMALFYCLRFVFRTFLLNFQGCHCSIIKVHLFVCAVRCSRRLCYFSTSLCACQVLF